MTPTNFEDDVLVNKVNIALAKSQRQIASWLPSRKAGEPQAKSGKDIEKDEQEIFTPAPEVLGLGGMIPKDGEMKRKDLSSDDKLGRMLLGSDYARKHADRNKGMETKALYRGPLSAGSKPRPARSAAQVEEDGENEGGRSSLGKSKMRAFRGPHQPSARLHENDAVDIEVGEMTGPAYSRRPLKRTNNYLDEVLADRSRKIHKKSRKGTAKQNCSE